DRLIGKCGDQLDLFLGEWLLLVPTDRNCTDSLVFPHKRNGQNRAMAHAKGHLSSVWKLLSRRLEVVNVDWCAIDDSASRYPATSDRPTSPGPAEPVYWDWAVVRFDVELIVLAKKNDSIVCLAEARRRLNERTKYRLKIEGRMADNLEH